MLARLAIVIVATAASAGLAPPAALHDSQPRFVITGRVEDPHNVRPADAMLTVGFDRDGVAYGIPVTMTGTGAFATNWLVPGTYVMTVIRNPYSATARSTPVGLAIARIVDSDVTGVTVTIRPDTAVEGQFRMSPGTPWPSSIVVTSCLEPEGIRLSGCVVAEGAPDGKFVLRNAFGPRLLTFGYTASPGQRYAPPRVLLDGKDITHVATDFSADPAAKLQVLFSEGSDQP